MKLLILGKGEAELWKLGADQFMGLINGVMESLVKENSDREMMPILEEYGFKDKKLEDVKLVHYSGHAESLAYYLLALGVDLEMLPPPASTLLLEYWTNLEGEVLTRVLFNERVLKLCGEDEFCGSRELHEFLHTRNKYFLKGHSEIRHVCWSAWMEGKRGFDLHFSAGDYLTSIGERYTCSTEYVPPKQRECFSGDG